MQAKGPKFTIQVSFSL